MTPRAAPGPRTLQHGAWVLLLLTTTSTPARALEVLSVKAAPAAGSGVYTMDGHVVLDAPPLAVRSVVTTVCTRYRKELPYVGFCGAFKQENRRLWTYTVIRPPILQPRDYVLVSDVDQDLAPDGKGTYRARWQASPDHGPPPRANHVRLQTNEGTWTITGRDDGKRTELTYHVRCTVGGVVPGWAAGHAARITFPDHMRLLERLAREEQRTGTVVAVSAEDPWLGLTLAPLDPSLMPPRTAPPDGGAP
jgi:hypothetical protein